MPNLFQSAIAFSAFLLLPVSSGVAQDLLNQPPQPDPMSQLTNVSELADVRPTDWAYQALQPLVERYGVIAGYPDRTFRGNRAMNRYEFAAGLNSAMNRIDQVLKTLPEQYATQEDLETLKKLQAEFAQELAVMKSKLGAIDSGQRLAEPFSTTTKLTGEVLLSLTGVGNADKVDNSGDPTDSNLTVGNRVRLNFDTSFFGKDRLRTRLQSSNIARVDRATGTDMARLAYQGDSEGSLEISRLEYRTPISKNATLYVSAVGGSLNDFANTFNPFLSGSGEGSVSRFGQRNPIYRIGGGAGVGLEYELNDDISLTVGYLGSEVNDPEQGFNKSAYSAIAQLSVEFSKTFGLGLTYVRSFNSLNTATGSELANNPFDDESEAITADSFGIQAAIALSKKLLFSGWAGFTRAKAADLEDDPRASIFNWAITIALPDLFREGNLAGFVIGQPPKLTSNDFSPNGEALEDEDTSLHFEAFYRHRVNDFISITPGIIFITNPEHNRDNNDIFIGTIRTTFSF
ncbi:MULTISPECIES: iron uptake porin [Leptolyngbya]|uniref:iron uptake porin n=1 Tax=Leptolyngbya TaxID=47251 RepID=UPI0016847F2D|nr:iron uptake porin [Leptolyngbya sp. FACHB-1624]MBD1854822.1 carbohydrate porin [Leptolyngbya sp. FACHB-1624]